VNNFTQDNDLLPKVAIIGGGTGSSTIITGLSPRFGERLTAISNMVDDGGSSGELRDQYGTLPPGDIRQAIAAMMPPGDKMLKARALLGYRFGQGKNGLSGLAGQSLGNLIIAAATEICGGDISEGIRFINQGIFSEAGRVLPVTKEDRRLVITTTKGKVIHGEHAVAMDKIPSLRGARIGYDKDPTVISKEADQAIKSADITIIAPGDLYTSIAPALAVKGMSQALSSSKVVVLIVNLMNRDRHTVGFDVGDYVDEAERIIGAKKPVIDYVIYNTALPDEKTLVRYAKEGESPVYFDEQKLKAASYKTIGKDFLSSEAVEVDPDDALGSTRSLIRHDPLKVALCILKIYGETVE
jgi:uncharacterized cofD-like protein